MKKSISLNKVIEFLFKSSLLFVCLASDAYLISTIISIFSEIGFYNPTSGLLTLLVIIPFSFLAALFIFALIVLIFVWFVKNIFTDREAIKSLPGIILGKFNFMKGKYYLWIFVVLQILVCIYFYLFFYLGYSNYLSF